MIKTPETHPDHSVVGHLYRGPTYDRGPQIYYCDSYDSEIGFWMTNVADATDRRNVSERAIDRTFHALERYDVEYAVHVWGKEHGNYWFLHAGHRKFYLVSGQEVWYISKGLDTAYDTLLFGRTEKVDATTMLYLG
jgi:hypothetical protein